MPEKEKERIVREFLPSYTRAVPVTNAILHFSFVPTKSNIKHHIHMIEVETRRIDQEWGEDGRYIDHPREAHTSETITGDDRQGHTFRPGHLPVLPAILPSPDVAA